jgi:hypothetical protein
MQSLTLAGEEKVGRNWLVGQFRRPARTQPAVASPNYKNNTILTRFYMDTVL